MHVCQIMLVEADTAEDAFSSVETKLSENSPNWSDWHNAGSERMNFAGRWSGQVFGTLDEAGHVKNPDKNPNHLQYSFDPALAEEVITRYVEERMRSINEYKVKAVDLASYKYEPYSNGFNMDLWGTKKLAQLLDDEWVPDSGIYDLEEWTGNLRYFTGRVAMNPTKQFLIPVDFHF